MRNSWIGLQLALQFFSALPIKRQLPMTKQTMTAMYSMMPVVGALFGAILVAVYEGLQWAETTPLFTAIILIVVHIICTGGLHLDGYVDVSDAFFSYGDKEKRLQILEDPRTGAFGVISVLVLLLLHVAALYELLMANATVTPLLLFVMPIILRTGVMLYFTTTACAKTSGIAHYFATNMKLRTVRLTAYAALAIISVCAIITTHYILVVAVIVQLLLVMLHRRFSYKHFGGMNGDLSGALYEGSQTILWLMLLLFI